MQVPQRSGQRFQGLRRFLSQWQNQGIQVKLAALLLASTASSIAIATYVILEVSEQKLYAQLRTELEHQSHSFGQKLASLNLENQLKATGLREQIETAEIDPNAASSPQLEQLLSDAIATDLQPNFFVVTDVNGRTIAQRSRSLADWQKMIYAIPSGESTLPSLQPVSVSPGIDLGQVAIVQDAIHTQQTLASAQLVPQTVLKELGLGAQARLSIRSKSIPDLPLEQQPLPIDEIDHSSGLVVMAVSPIKAQGKVTGCVIAGTLLNRDYTLVDQFKGDSRVAEVSIFAQDLQVSTTNVIDSSNIREIGALSARQVTQTVLRQAQPFVSETFIDYNPYLTLYQPIYDHRHSLNPHHAKPIGMYRVSESAAGIDRLLTQLALTGGSIAAGMMIIVGLGIIPISRKFAAPVQQLTDLAQQIGRGEQQIQFPLSDRQDEVGILTNELNGMVRRLVLQL